ncbi:50S ribosomal protein L28 [candidate division KSB1 bacterium 4572_119]|nr:MAG: 50S ribosomal protein L28 [candidate division KSB1 bacterium 4572_119]
MAKQCDICGKKPQVGNIVTHAHNLVKRRFKPNVHKMKILVDGTVKRASVCTRCLRSGKVTKVV